MPTYDHGTSGLVGTVAVTVLDSTGAVHVARSTSGITEVGEGIYFTPDHDTAVTLTYVWDDGDTSASETVYAGGGGGGATAAQVWGYSSRSLTDKADFSLTSAYTNSLTDVASSVRTELATELGMIAVAKRILANKMVESTDGTTVTIYNDDNSTVLGTFTWNEGTKTRGKLG